PSPLAEAYLRDVGQSLAGTGASPIDLFAWIKRTLTPGPDVKLGRRAFSRVVLTGGSSEWPFMKDLAAEGFQVERDNIICSATPETRIGSGLAVYNVLRRRYEKTCVYLREEMPDRTAQFTAAVTARLKAFAGDVTTAAVGGLMAQVETVFLHWHREGGALNDV